jgi:hypothetical protein
MGRRARQRARGLPAILRRGRRPEARGDRRADRLRRYGERRIGDYANFRVCRE